jgi:hypothetical protein
MRSLTLGPLVGAALLAGVVCLAVPTSLESQTRTLGWTETTRVEMPGALGVMLRAMPGSQAGHTSRQTIHIQGRSLIQETDGGATILDVENRRFISIDHEAGTYTVVTFDEAAATAREFAAMMAEAAADDPAAREWEQATEEARAELTFRISAEQTGRTRSIGTAGTATQHLMLAELEVTAPPEGVEEVEEGTLVFLMELWQSTDVPTEEAFYEAWAAALADDPELQAFGADMADAAGSASESGALAMAAWDPRVSAGMMELADAMEQMEGTTVQSVLTVAVVPTGVALDRDALLAWEPASMGDQLRAGAAGAAADAARSAVRGLTGRLGRGRQQEEAAADPAAAVTRPLLRSTTTREDIVYRESDDDVLGPLLSRMEGYRQITLEDLRQER